MVVPVKSSMAGIGVFVPTVSTNLSGIGDLYCGDGYSCAAFDENGDCSTCLPDSSGPGGSSTTLNYPGLTPGTTPTPGSILISAPSATQPDGTPWPFAAGAGSSVSATGSYMSQGGNIITTYSDGSFTMVSPSTGSVSKGQGTPPPAAQGTVTQAQASAWPSIVASLAAAGVKLGTVAQLQPGQTLLPNGTILGSGQSLIGGNITSSNQQFAAILTNPMFLIAGAAVILLALAEGR